MKKLHQLTSSLSISLPSSRTYDFDAYQANMAPSPPTPGSYAMDSHKGPTRLERTTHLVREISENAELRQHNDQRSLGLNPYVYKPLPPGSFRLLRILKADRAKRLIKCTLETHVFVDAPVFEALSYTWGAPLYSEPYDPQKSAYFAYEIQCDREGCFVTMNLFDALFEIARLRKGILIWIDALCIDQQNLKEKENQVSSMGDIYASARQVIVWLGVSEEENFDIKAWRRRVEKACANFEAKHGGNTVRKQEPLDRNVLKDMQVTMDEWESGWKSYFKFFRQRRWFRRSWIIQEIALARKTLFLTGNEEIDWEDLHRLGSIIRRNGWRHVLAGRLEDDDGWLVGIGDEADNLLEYQRQVRNGGPNDDHLRMWFEKVEAVKTDEQRWVAYLQYMVQETRRFQATDDRDKIFAVLGMVNRFTPAVAKASVKPDYQSDITTVYTVFTKFLLSYLPSPSTLSYVDNYHSRLDLPSWVPDYSEPLGKKPLIHLGGGYIFHASYSKAATASSEIKFDDIEFPSTLTTSIISSSITLQGLYIGSVSKRLPFSAYEIKWEDVVGIWTACLVELSPIYLLTGQDRVEAFWRTLIANVNERPPKVHPAPTEYGAHFHDWILDIMVMQASKKSKWQRPDWYVKEEERWSKSFERTMKTLSTQSGLLPTEEEWKQAMDNFDPQKAEHKQQEPRPVHSTEGRYLFERAQLEVCTDRVIFITDQGYLGLGPKSLLLKDEIWLLQGAKVPFVLHEHEDATMRLVGEAYVHGAMHGELAEGKKFEDIRIH